MKKAFVIFLIVIVIANALGIGVREVYSRYEDAKSTAYSAQAHLRQAEAELRALAGSKDLSRISRVGEEFADARDDFARINAQLDGLGPLYGIAEAMPLVGEQARVARRLMRAGEYVSEAGEEAAKGGKAVLDAGRQRPELRNTELIMAAAPAATEHLSAALEALAAAREEYEGISTQSLHPLIAEALVELASRVPEQQALLRNGLDLLEALPAVLGKDGERTYLVLVQDDAEIRPTGGFIGNYGVLRFREGKMVESTFNDSYAVDWPYYFTGKSSPPVAMFLRYFPESTFWALRDSNIWPDFPRSASQAAQFAVIEGVAERIDGVIGITGDVVRPLMRVVGTIDVPEFGETVDESNVLDRIRYHETAESSAQMRRNLGAAAEGNRKLFTSLLLGRIVDRLNGLDMAGFVNLVLSLEDSVKGKGLQVYFEDSRLQGLAEAYELAGTFKPVTSDYLWVIDMNLTPSKDNLYVKPSIKYSVSIESTGAISELELIYDYSRQQGNRFLGTIIHPYYSDYVRAFVPPGSKLLGEEETEEPIETSSEAGKTVLSTFFKTYPGTVRRIKLRYWQPLRMWTDGGRATYELVVQKQAGNNVESFEARVTPPPGALVVDASGFQIDGRRLVFSGPLRSDMRLTATLRVP